MSQPQERVQEDLKQSMKARDAERTSTLRMLLAELKNERIKLGHEVSEDEFLVVLQRGVKQRQDSVEQYRNAGREDLASKEDREAKLLGSYLPAPVSEAEVRQAVEELVRAEGLAGPSGIGRVMQTVLPRFKGRFDGKALQKIAREVLGA
ncbi:MAG TPA: GatB/YqeY domain-containing protein [Thermoanaerobaculia bacterium]|jgi:hypothetical protein|nr:GatB/YqeY domain-containing protein [Thermoanaerobaculia bacterium]